MPAGAKAARALLAVALTLVVLGCEGSNGRIPIRGTVTYKGTPLAHGTITFSPKDSAKGMIEGAPITDGKYALPADKGLLPGSYHVAVSATDAQDGKPAEDVAPGAPRRSKELLPERYNTKSTLSIEVTATGKRDFDFPLD
jgi:hypothetical protein